MYFIAFLLIKDLQLSEVTGFIVDFMSSSFVSHSFENEEKMSEFIVYYKKHNKYFLLLCSQSSYKFSTLKDK